MRRLAHLMMVLMLKVVELELDVPQRQQYLRMGLTKPCKHPAVVTEEPPAASYRRCLLCMAAWPKRERKQAQVQARPWLECRPQTLQALVCCIGHKSAGMPAWHGVLGRACNHFSSARSLVQS